MLKTEIEMTTVTINHVYGIQIEYKDATDTKPAKYILRLNGSKKTYSVPQLDQLSDSYAELLELFYKDLNLDIPKNGFDVFRITNLVRFAIPKQN